MFCFQCQETAGNKGCTMRGVCGKMESTANLQDLLIFSLKGLSIWDQKARELGIQEKETGRFIAEGLFNTITNANFDDARFVVLVRETLKKRDQLKDRVLSAWKDKHGAELSEELHGSATWYSDDPQVFAEKAKEVGVLSTLNEDVRSLRELLVIGLKGICAYADHAAILGFEDDSIYDFASKQIIHRGSRFASAAYDKTSQSFASERAQRDAENRAAREVAEQLRFAIASDLSSS